MRAPEHRIRIGVEIGREARKQAVNVPVRPFMGNAHISFPSGRCAVLKDLRRGLGIALGSLKHAVTAGLCQVVNSSAEYSLLVLSVGADPGAPGARPASQCFTHTPRNPQSSTSWPWYPQRSRRTCTKTRNRDSWGFGLQTRRQTGLCLVGIAGGFF